MKGKLLACLVTIFMLAPFSGIRAESPLMLLSDNARHGPFYSVPPQESHRLEASPQDAKDRVNLSERSIFTGATYSYPDGAPDYSDQGSSVYLDPDCDKLIWNRFHPVIWRNAVQMRTVEFDLQAPYLIEKVVIHTVNWSPHYAMDQISFQVEENGEWKSLDELNTAGYEAHPPEEKEYYYISSGLIKKSAQRLRISFQNREPKCLIIRGIEIWGKENE